jgi:uncharacterized protein (TIGR04255 family)
MPFPASPRVVYENNPLVEVICQLRFPPILRIDAEPPAQFQDRIRTQFPLLEEKSALGIPDEIANVFAMEMKTTKNYHFNSTDGEWTVNLTRDFFALTARRYKRWEEFREHLATPLEAFITLYTPVYFTRVGLRYRDLIKRSTLRLAQRPWEDLLEPHILGPLAKPEVSRHTDLQRSEFRIALTEGVGTVHVRHGLHRDGEEPCYVIDCDFYNDSQTGTGDAYARLDHFKRRAGRLFRWCIKESLHRAMGPREIPEGA